MPHLRDGDVIRIVNALDDDFREHNERLRIRRLLIEQVAESFTNNKTGTNVAEPFDKSSLIIQTMIGEPIREVQRYAARIAANEPVISVIPQAIDERPGPTLAKRAALQERLHQWLWFTSEGRRKQRQIAWSQCWGRTGYYLSLPSDVAWGLPSREFYEDLSDEEADRIGAITDPLHGYAESAESWFERRKMAMRDRAISGRGLSTLEALPPDIVRIRRDNAGVKFAAIVEEVPQGDFQAGEEMARAAARYLGIAPNDVERYGLYIDKEGRVQGGISDGSEPNAHSGQTWTLTRFLTRDEVFYIVSADSSGSGGKIIWHAYHHDGVVPVFEVPFAETDSRRPGGNATSPLEAIFAMTPLMNQLMTFLSNIAAYNSMPRWVIETTEGNLLPDPETGDPKIITGSEETIGLDPKDAVQVGGKIRQLVIDGAFLLQVLQFYAVRMDRVAIPEVAVGAAATYGPAWNVRQQIAQVQIDLESAVDAHAAAVAAIHRVWIKRLRKLDITIIGLDPKGRPRELFEVEPDNLTEAITVRQDSNTASDRVVLLQSGLELLNAGVIDDETFYERYALEEDPEDAIVRKYVQLGARYILEGAGVLQPGSLIAQVAESVRGRLSFWLLQQSPNFALSTAEDMVASAQMQANAGTPMAPEGQPGNVAEAQGLRQPGIGMGATLPGGPGGGVPLPAAGVR